MADCAMIWPFPTPSQLETSRRPLQARRLRQRPPALPDARADADLPGGIIVSYIRTTRDLAKACAIVDIKLHDHVVIGQTSETSFHVLRIL